MQKLLKLLVLKRNINFLIIITAALVYCLSPILIIMQYAVFLYAVWTVGVLPAFLYYWIVYLKTGKAQNLIFVSLLSIILAMAFYSIPWVLGFLLALVVGLLVVIYVNRLEIPKTYISRMFHFIGVVTLVHAYWLLPFSMNFLARGSNSYGSTILSVETANTFSPTVSSTAIGNIVYPLLNLFHRQIAFNFNWPLKQVFLNFYDKIMVLDLIFPTLLLIGLLYSKRFLTKEQKNIYVIFLVAFTFSLFLFTVNIGPLKQIFLFLGYMPGFVMFRNFYDKFAVGYVFSYSIVLFFSLIIIFEYSKRIVKYLIPLLIILLLLNAAALKSLINKPLWTTKDTGLNIAISTEYLDFMNQVKVTEDRTTNI
jgi:hypothetical protein